MDTRTDSLPDPKRHLATAFGVLVLATLVALHEVILRLATGRTGPGGAASSYLLLALWGFAAPVIARSAAKWPVGNAFGWKHIGRHLLHAVAFIVATNLMIRIPRVWIEPQFGIEDLAFSTMSGVLVYGPSAAIVYALIVAVGHYGLSPSDSATSVPDRIEAADALAGAQAERSDDRSDDAPRASTTLLVREGDTQRFLGIDEIDWIEADDNYVKVAAAGRVHRIRMRISEVEAKLPESAFVRVHRSAIVPVERVRSVVPGLHGDWMVELSSGREFAVARGRRRELEARLAQRT